MNQERLNTFFDKVFRLVVTLAAIWAAYVLSSMFFAPPPYELEVVNPKPYVVCPGDKFTYQANVIVRRTPVTLMRTDTWFSYTTNNNVTADKFDEVEIFNWDKKVHSIVPRTKIVNVPETTMDGTPLLPGKYRYIVNLNSWGVSTPASMSFEVTVPENCS